MAQAHYEEMKAEMDQLKSENKAISNDLVEATKMLKETQAHLSALMAQEEERVKQQQESQRLLEKQQETLHVTRALQENESEKNAHLRSAYNADRKVM